MKKTLSALAILYIVLIAGLSLLSTFFSQEGDLGVQLMNRFCSLSTEHLLGCDHLGRDLFWMIAFGSKITLSLALSVVVITLIIGTIIGAISGWMGGWVDTLMMRAVDVALTLPGILIAMIIAAYLGGGFGNLLLALSVTGWTGPARLVRAQVMFLKNAPFIEATRCFGFSIQRVFWIHLLPNLTTILVIQGTFSLSGVILVESSLSFLGLGLGHEAPSWGLMLGNAKSYLSTHPMLSMIPGMLIFFLILSLNFLGDVLRDKTDLQSLTKNA